MAKDVRFIYTCDPCDSKDRSVEAVATHSFTIDGGEEKAIEFCGPHEDLLQDLLAVYRDGGRPLPPKTLPEAPARKPRAKAVKPPKPKELEQAPVETPPAKEPAAPQEEPAKKVKKERRKQYIACPRDHKTGDSPKRVNYEDRNSHASVIHDGAKIWEIHWQDPDGILPRDDEGNLLYACDAHTECQKTELAFTSAAGLRTHKNSSPLSRIDQDLPSDPETP